ncbi:MogA/MoaB family molybdenum cofactor biosynthesis protein [Candidatus Contubernalis alkaliaceticus]|uniref:MogA/MoaB family molybdenum cofactor biosynthesis protein n=1 Tax=Candidatus Contubernalis alkaliaceticus TaxID=338645 RepID=UPI001F4C4A57|nr:MogA/MoaB family molybdenum cofactor biosynthesis protein [Candidatus Contubernalis alkalaceticus]UNC91503.1 MogA/MoaB family molybdenum cofactor biosynthesis protein [Candidatus Contubernalis alkalaceticus]
MFGAAVLTASDRGARGEREDKSGKVIEEIVQRLGGKVMESALVSDDPESIREKLIYFADQLKAEVILTTGGTGLSPRDNTPEATLSVIEKVVPGLAEAMRAESLKKTPHAMLSRAVCGVRGSSLIINLPGSPKAVRECLEVIEPALPHAVELIKGRVSDCAQGEHNGLK